jgi:molybdate-binding protein
LGLVARTRAEGLRDVADATIQAGSATARAMPGTAQIAELLAEISQAIAHNH